jgi:hypothetical protein
MTRATLGYFLLLTFAVPLGCADSTHKVLPTNCTGSSCGTASVYTPDASVKDAPLKMDTGNDSYLINCTVNRQEATQMTECPDPRTGGQTPMPCYIPTSLKSTAFTASLCVSSPLPSNLNQICNTAFCTAPGGNPQYPGYPLADSRLATLFTTTPMCSAVASGTPAQVTSGWCQPTVGSSHAGMKSASVTCTLAGRDCVPVTSGNPITDGTNTAVSITVTNSVEWVNPSDPTLTFTGLSTSTVTQSTTLTNSETQTAPYTGTITATGIGTETITGVSTYTKTGTSTASATGSSTGVTTATVTTTLTQTAVLTSVVTTQPSPNVNPICNSLNTNSFTIAGTANKTLGCFDSSKQSAYDYCANNWQYRIYDQDVYGYVVLSAFSAYDTNCPAVIAASGGGSSTFPDLQPGETAYGLTRSAHVGLVSIGIGSAGLVAKAGYFVTSTNCGGSPCLGPALSRMKVVLEDVSLFGIRFANPTLELLAPAYSNEGNLSPGSMVMQAGMDVSGSHYETQLTNLGKMTVNLSPDSNSLTFAGEMATNVANEGGTGLNLPLTIWANASASTSSPGASCVGLNRTGMIFGFEDLSLWTSNQTKLVLSKRTPTQGCYAMDVPGTGYRTLNSATFSTPISGATSTLGLDVFNPSNPPNPSWLGAVQMYATCPSANMNNAYIGQVELTGRPVGAYSTLSFPIPSAVNSVLAQAHSDCFLSIAVNANSTPTPPTLDNLRFLP